MQDNIDTDNVSQESLEIEVVNKPKTDLSLQSYNYSNDSDEWAYVQVNNVYYVWIPRFAYKTDGEDNITIKFVKGNSNIATDDTYIDNTWTIHNRFKDSNGNELTGIWLSVNSNNQTELDMIDLLEDNSLTIL